MKTKIIAFSGKKQSGKTICSEFLQQLFLSNGYDDVALYSFADPLKEDICMNMFGLTHIQCYGEDHNKNELVDAYWEDKQLTARELMQFVGTEVFRKLNSNVWVNALLNKIHRSNHDVVIVCDCRFPNEVEAIQKNQGLVFRLTRNPHDSDHISETILDQINYNWSQFDAIIDNVDMSVRDQFETIKKLMIKFNMLPRKSK